MTKVSEELSVVENASIGILPPVESTVYDISPVYTTSPAAESFKKSECVVT